MHLKKIVLIFGLTIFIFSMILNSGLIAQARKIDRIVTVTAVADEEYIDFYGENEWKDRARRIIERASRAFEQFGIGFEVIKFEVWNSEEHIHPRLSRNYSYYTHPGSQSNETYVVLSMPFTSGFNIDPCCELEKEIKPENADIVIAFTGQPDLGIAGRVADLSERYLLIVDFPATLPWFVKKYREFLEICRSQKNLELRNENLRFLEQWFNLYRKIMPELLVNKGYEITRVLIHELGHLFGAEHTEENSVMNVPATTNQFDEKNRKIVINNKWRKFK